MVYHIVFGKGKGLRSLGREGGAFSLASSMLLELLL